jgi:hypothetical protein
MCRIGGGGIDIKTESMKTVFSVMVTFLNSGSMVRGQHVVA